MAVCEKICTPRFCRHAGRNIRATRKRICGTNLNNSYLWLRVAGICEKVVTLAQIKKNSFPMNINKAFLCTVVVAILAGLELQSCNDDDNYGERK